MSLMNFYMKLGSVIITAFFNIISWKTISHFSVILTIFLNNKAITNIVKYGNTVAPIYFIHPL